VEFIEKQTKDKPFFLFLGFKSAHGPRGGESLPERLRGMYANQESHDSPNVGVEAIYHTGDAGQRPPARRRNEQKFKGHRAYMQHITAVDGCIGRVLDALDRTGQAENTIVIVTSDNGYYLGEHGLGDKRTAYDESMRVPLLIRTPDKDAPRGVASEAIALNIDYAPTILDFAGAEPLPAAQGRSLRPAMSGKLPPDWRSSFFYEYFKEGEFPPPTVFAVRTATHKLITYPGHDEWTEVFDIKNDPYELRNLVSDSELLKKLQSEFDAQAKAVQFRMPAGVGVAKDKPGRTRAKGQRKGQAKSP
jgi:N-acetylglucosamine-6-sulfatase